MILKLAQSASSVHGSYTKVARMSGMAQTQVFRHKSQGCLRLVLRSFSFSTSDIVRRSLLTISYLFDDPSSTFNEQAMFDRVALLVVRTIGWGIIRGNNTDMRVSSSCRVSSCFFSSASQTMGSPRSTSGIT